MNLEKLNLNKTMKNSARILRLVGTFDLLTGIVLIFLAVFFYISGQKLYDSSGEMTITFILLLIGVFFLINSPIVFFVAKKTEEKNNSPVQY
jgi:uncharacterized membrane protein HdeD (DUF308 family)